MIISKYIKHLSNLIFNTEYRRKYCCLEKIRKCPRYTLIKTDLFLHDIELIDSVSFLSMYSAIFEKEIYKFKSENQQVLIIDCGANIGLSTIYFKMKYPDSYIYAFEPDIKIFSVLKKNIEKFNFNNVQLINKALWSSESSMFFMEEGADAGRIVELEPNKTRQKVETVRLRNYLEKPINLLKIDIEGAETEVLIDCKDLLYNVNNIFVEYHSFINVPQTLHSILQILQNAKFRVHIQPGFCSSNPFISQENYLGMDLQLNIFGTKESI
ncbi:MAG: methyltransferase FkbM family [uncultured bacterium]|nr:MAG: methyltransferase FkbM family [uncultured bacterium]